MSEQRPITKLFIANRGEIARRIAQTAVRRGIATVALRAAERPVPAYLWGLVSEFIEVSSESASTYLDSALMIALAKSVGADAVHPGFGFLSENSDFAEAVEAAGMCWVGPRPAAIKAMASKARARDYAERAGVPCLQGLGGLVLDGTAAPLEKLQAFAAKTGFPLLIKAALGGGGKGMRIVTRVEDLQTAAEAASREALSSFGDAALIVERYLQAPRHIEVQVLGDASGQIFTIGDRDCSLQRRHQKILEEAPAPELHPETRRQLHAAAVQLAKAVGYSSAGTVEFLLDGKAPATAFQPFYFLEMNTRLQVEHPVTEEVFGLDLVDWQLRIAMGEAMPADFAQLKAQGHSVEVRIYAENVENDFMPAPGKVWAFVPHQEPGLRWELGLDPIDEITPRFDPMIAKLIATGATRAEAMQRLAAGLERTILAGPTHNIPYLLCLLRDPAFVAAPVTTHYVKDSLTSVLERLKAEHDKHAPLASNLQQLLSAAGVSVGSAVQPAHSARANHVQQIFNITAQPASPYAILSCRRQLLSGVVARQSLVTEVEHVLVRTENAVLRPAAWALSRRPEATELWVFIDGASYVFQALRSLGRTQGESGALDDTLRAPLPGRIVKLNAPVGTAVSAQQTVAILESMKMEFEVKATRQGIISALCVQVGEQVEADQVLMRWKE